MSSVTEIVHASCRLEYVAFITASRAVRPLNVFRSMLYQKHAPSKLVQDLETLRVLYA
jgi:hypothetical protein